jgi:hypothetical protein
MLDEQEYVQEQHDKTKDPTYIRPIGAKANFNKRMGCLNAHPSIYFDQLPFIYKQLGDRNL